MPSTLPQNEITKCEKCLAKGYGRDMISYRKQSRLTFCRECAHDPDVIATYLRCDETWTCPKHPDKEVECFCTTCHQGACLECGHNKPHLSHEVIEGEDVAHNFRQVLTEKTGPLSVKRKEISKRKEQLRHCKNRVKVHLEKVAADMMDTVNEEKKSTTRRLESTDANNTIRLGPRTILVFRNDSKLKEAANTALGEIEILDDKQRMFTRSLEQYQLHTSDVLLKMEKQLEIVDDLCDSTRNDIQFHVKACQQNGGHIAMTTSAKKLLSRASNALTQELPDVDSASARIFDELPTFVHTQIKGSWFDVQERSRRQLYFCVMSVFQRVSILIQISWLLLNSYDGLMTTEVFSFRWMSLLLQTELIFSSNICLPITNHFFPNYPRVNIPIDIKYHVSGKMRTKLTWIKIRQVVKGIALCQLFNLIFLVSVLACLKLLEVQKANLDISILISVVQILIFKLVFRYVKHFRCLSVLSEYWEHDNHDVWMCG